MSKTFEDVMVKVRPVSSETALSDEEAALLWECASEVPVNGLGIEVGAQLGRSSVLIAQLAEEFEFHTIHIDPHTDQRQWSMDWVGNMMTALDPMNHAFAAFFMRTEQAASLLRRLAPFDFAYVDGDHEYPGVMTDLTILCPLLSPGGLLLMHDYGRDSLPGVWQAANEYLKDDEWDQIGLRGTMGAWRKRC